MEEWRQVKGYEGLYEVSSLGRVKSTHRSKHIILSAANDNGYLKIVLQKSKTRKTTRVHRIVAENFIANPKNKPEVNHINGNKLDNSVDNLEWCTRDENARHAAENGLYGSRELTPEHKDKLIEVNSKKVVCVCSGTIYSSATEAAKANGIKKSTLIHYLIGSRKNKTTLEYLK